MFAKKMLAVGMLLPVTGVVGEEVSWPAPPSAYKTDTNLPKGTLSPVIQYPTASYNNRNCRVYTPPGYSATRSEKYPVLYLHHGIGGNENAWTSSEGNADKVMNYLYAQANLSVTPMIVVMPMGNMTGTSGDAWRNYEKVLINDLIPYIEKNYNASTDPNMRAMAGLSMGGGQTTLFAYRNLNTFTWIGAFSPAPSWGEPAQNITDIAGVRTKVHLNYFSGGTSEGDFLARAKRFHDHLSNNGVTKVILQTEQGLPHNAENWNRNLHHFAQRIFKLETVDISFYQKPRNVKTASSGKSLKLSPSTSMLMIVHDKSKDTPRFSLNGKQFNSISQYQEFQH